MDLMSGYNQHRKFKLLWFLTEGSMRGLIFLFSFSLWLEGLRWWPSCPRLWELHRKLIVALSNSVPPGVFISVMDRYERRSWIALERRESLFLSSVFQVYTNFSCSIHSNAQLFKENHYVIFFSTPVSPPRGVTSLILSYQEVCSLCSLLTLLPFMGVPVRITVCRCL